MIHVYSDNVTYFESFPSISSDTVKSFHVFCQDIYLRDMRSNAVVVKWSLIVWYVVEGTCMARHTQGELTCHVVVIHISVMTSLSVVQVIQDM